MQRMKRSRRHQRGLKMQNIENSWDLLVPRIKIPLDNTPIKVKYCPRIPNRILVCDEEGYLLGKNLDKIDQPFYHDGSDGEEGLVIREEFVNYSKKIVDNQIISEIEWFEDPKDILIGVGDGNIFKFDLAKNKISGKFERNHSKRIQKLSISCKNKHILSTSKDGKLILWDERAKERIGRVYKDLSRSDMFQFYTSAAFYKDEYTFITTNNTNEIIEIWDLRKIAFKKTDFKKLEICIVDKVHHRSYLDYKIGLIYRMMSSLTSQVHDYQTIIDNFNNLQSEFSEGKETGVSCGFGIADSTFDSEFRYLLVTGLNKMLYLHRVREIGVEKPLILETGKTSLYSSSCFFQGGQGIVSGTKDGSINIFNSFYEQEDEVIKPSTNLKNYHTSEINSIATSRYPYFPLASVSDDKNLVLWSPKIN